MSRGCSVNSARTASRTRQFDAIMRKKQARKEEIKDQERARTFGFVSEGKNIGVVARFQGADIVVFCAFEDLCEGTEIHTEWERAIAAETFETRRVELDCYEGNVGVVHGLELLG